MSEREQESTETDVLQAFRRAVDAMNVGRHEEARRALRDLTEEAPGFTWAWQEMTQAALRSGSHRELEEELRRQGKQRPNEPGPRHALGYLSRRLGRPVAKTRRYLQSALERDAACWPAAMELAALDIDMGRPERAEPKFRSLQETFSRLGDLWGEATALNYQGHVARARFDYAAALTIYPRVMKLKMAVGDLAGAAGALSNLGLLALEVGEHRESLKYFRDSLELQERVGDRVGSAHVMILMAAAHEDRGRLEDARSLLRVAQRVVRQLGHERLLVYVLVNQAHVALRGRRFSRAEALLKEALGEAERIGMAREQAGAQLYLSSLARERGRLEEAEAGLARAKSLSRRSRDRLHRVAVATEEAALALRRGEPARALRAARFAMRLHAQHRGLGGGL
ncbi:MAG: tetratricopeptide repeat protein [Acidobacteriota bacterium]